MLIRVNFKMFNIKIYGYPVLNVNSIEAQIKYEINFLKAGYS